MSKKLLVVISIMLLAAMILPACAPKTAATTEPPTTAETTAPVTKANGEWNIVLVTPYGAVPYWQQIEAGMKQANVDLGTNVQYIGPSDLNLDEQLKAIQTAIDEKVDGIITNGYVPESFTPLFQKAKDAGIPVVLVDADDPASVRVTYIGTSNLSAGQSAGEAMAKCLNGKGSVGILTGVIGSSNIDDRVTGFKTALEKFPDIKVVDMEVTNVDLQTANEKAGTMLTAYPEITGLYGTTEPDIIGAAQVTDQRGANLCLVGFDDATQTIDYIKKGVIYATMVQKPYLMGYKSVQVMLDILNGKTVDPIIDTGVTTVTKENVYTYKAGPDAKAPGDYKIVLVTPYGAVPYWQKIEAGMKQANADFGAKVEYIGPSDLNLDEQLKAIQTAIDEKVDGIITNGYVPESFTPLFQKAKDAGIPVVLVDADDPASVRVTYIGTSNLSAGQSAGEAMAKCLNGKGSVGILTGVIGSSNIDDRVTGFKTALEKFPDIKVVDMEVTNVDLQIANEKAGTMLTAYPEITGLYGTTEPDIIGAAQTVSNKNLTGMCLVGFDDATQTIDFIKQGVIYATMVQKPFQMGYMGVETMLNILNGETVPAIIDTGVTVVTKDNVDTYNK